MPASHRNFLSSRQSVNGLWIHTRQSGPTASENNPPIVLVHGLGVSGRYMLPTAERLAVTHQVFVPDLPGFGQSDKPRRALNVAELADHLAAWMPTIGINCASFLGNSLGCQVVVDLALRYPQCVHRAILVGPTIDRIDRTMPRQLWRGWRDLCGEPWSLWKILARDYFSTGTLRMYRTFRHALNDAVELKFPRVQTPTLVVRGGRDTIAPQRWVEEIVASLPYGRLVVIPRATHAANYSAPEELTEAVIQFLAGLEFTAEASNTP